MSRLMASVSGVRGIWGEGMDPSAAMEFAARFGLFQKRGKIVVGRDSRVTGPVLHHAVVAGLTGVGCDVVDLGIVSTPTVLLAVEDSDAAGGIGITASHNPAQWNAMKFVDSNGLFLYPERAKAFLESASESIDWCGWNEVGSVHTDSRATDRHIAKILSIPYIDVQAIQKKRYKVVIDAVNGAGGLIVPRLLRKLNCEVIELNCQPTGHFAHEPEPLNKNLKQLEEAVREHGADIGFAVDPDVDRLAIVSEKGNAIGEEFTLLIASKYVLAKKPGPVATNLSSSMASEDIAAEFGVPVYRTKVGEINVGVTMIEKNAAIGGEGNGGVICPEVHTTRDAPAGIALVLSAMAEGEMEISGLTDEIPRYHFAKDKIEVDSGRLDLIMQKALAGFADHKIDRTDGIKVLGDKHWIHIRKSGTEPIIRVYVEAQTPEEASRLCKDTIQRLT